MKTHEQFADDLALYALDELTGSEKKDFEEHVAACVACRRDLQMLRGDLGLLALSSSGPQPPARSKERLMRAIASEPRRKPQVAQTRRRRLWPTLVPAFAALGLLAFTAALLLNRSDLQYQVAILQTHNRDLGDQLDRLNEEVRLLSAPDAVHVSLNPQNSPRRPTGTAIFSPSQKQLMFMATNFLPVSAGKAYELWIIPTAGAPIPAGLFKPDEHGNGIILGEKLPEGVTAKAFAITIENESGSDQPTSPILLVGTVS
ncbi:MAG: anti-sigma factor [Acidobacteriaceae bacterium]|nr:anti-sigma factor [Acidobacteriaceae bacterium]